MSSPSEKRSAVANNALNADTMAGNRWFAERKCK